MEKYYTNIPFLICISINILLGDVYAKLINPDVTVLREIIASAVVALAVFWLFKRYSIDRSNMKGGMHASFWCAFLSQLASYMIILSVNFQNFWEAVVLFVMLFFFGIYGYIFIFTNVVCLFFAYLKPWQDPKEKIKYLK